MSWEHDFGSILLCRLSICNTFDQLSQKDHRASLAYIWMPQLKIRSWVGLRPNSSSLFTLHTVYVWTIAIADINSQFCQTESIPNIKYNKIIQLLRIVVNKVPSYDEYAVPSAT